MFSVIIPLYNKAPYIQKTVKSVLSQTFEDFELIIINDGSTDTSAEQLAIFKDDRVQIVTQTNAGVSIARNVGVQYARYKYIAFLDGDDWWHDCFLQEMHQLITRFPEAAMYGSSYFIVKNRQNKIANIGVEPTFKSGFINYFEVYAKTFWVPINCSFVIILKSVFDKELGFNPILRFGEDFDLWSRIAINYKVCYVNKPLAYSNQDVDLSNRAINYTKNWLKEEHYIFNLQHLDSVQKQIPALTKLLYGLKVRSLMIFYLKNLYLDEVNSALALIDWSTQPFYYRLIYTSPKIFVNGYFTLKKIGSNLKKIINTSKVYCILFRGTLHV